MLRDFLIQKTYRLVPAFAVTAAAVAAEAAAATGTWFFFFWLSFHHTDSSAFYYAIVQFSNCFIGSFCIWHFHETESTAFASEFVCDYFSGRNFAIFCKKFSKVFILYVEAQVGNVNVHTFFLKKLFLTNLRRGKKVKGLTNSRNRSRLIVHLPYAM